MKFFSILVILSVLLVQLVYSKKPEDPSVGVIDVTSANKASVFAKGTAALVEFYAPWCGHCKTLAPEYAKLGAAFDKARPQDVVVAKVDCTKESDICKTYGVSGYPTLKFFPKGTTDPEDYKGGRTADDLVKFINDKTGSRLFIAKDPTFAPELDESDFDKTVLVKGKQALVMFYAPWCGHCKKMKPDYEILGKVFQNEPDVVIAKVDATKSPGLGSKYEVKGYPTLKWVTDNNKVEDANTGRSLDALVKYVNQRAGTFRTTTGLLNDDAGLNAGLSEIASKFLGSSDKDGLIKQAEEALSKMTSLAADEKKAIGYYVRAMKKIAKGGKDYVQKEITRLNNLLKSKSVSAKFLDSFKKRVNILSKF